MSNNKIILEGCISQFKSVNELVLNDGEVFELFALTQITKSFELSFENISNSIVDGGHDGGIDSILVLVDDEVIDSLDELDEYNFSSKTKTRIIISQCKKENSFKESALDKLITSIPVLFDLGKNETALLSRFNSDVVNAAINAREIWTKTAINGGEISVDYNYACNAPEIEINGTFSGKVNQLMELSENIFSMRNLTYTNYSSTELLKQYQIHKSNRLVLEFKEQPLSTSYLNHGIGYIGMVKLADYQSFIKSDTNEIRDDLFESNIRHFQGEVDVNKKIRHTVENISNKDFWWLNNGITIIADSPNQIGKKLALENVQIVNGLQTSYSIFNYHNGDTTDERCVLVKVIINNDKETIDNIIESTNSQNPVSATLLRATESTQRNLELYFFNEGYFYDRRKNYYKNQGKPASKIFSIQYTAQAIRSIIFSDPHSSRAKPTSLLKDDKSYYEIFNPNNNFRGYLKCCLICKKSNDFWLTISNSAFKNKTSNFKLHLAWLFPIILLRKNKLSFEDITNIDVALLNQAVFDDTLACLLSYIEEFQQINPESNLINMAKSSDFTRYITEKLVGNSNA
jgi:hypothetical protein